MEQTIDNRSLTDIYNTRTHIETIKNGENDGIKGLIVERINNAYSWGVYGNFKLIIRDVDGYVNGTQLIREAITFENSEREKIGLKPIGRHSMAEWQKNDSTILLVNTLKQEVRNLTSKLIDRVKGKQLIGEEMVQGTYIHPRLVNSLATWVSPSYALIVGDLMNEHFLKNKVSAEQKRIRDLENVVVKKDDVIADLRDMYNSISEKFQVSINKSDKILVELKKSNQKLDTTNNFLRSIARDIRVETEPGNDHSLVICRIAPAPVTDGNFEYKAIRVLNENFDDRIRQAEKIYGGAFQVLRTFKTPNPIQVWKKIKSSCAGIVCEIRSTNFNFAGTEKRLLARIKKIVAGSVARVKNVVDN